MAIKRTQLWKRCAAILGALALGLASFSALANEAPQQHKAKPEKGMSHHQEHAPPILDSEPPSITRAAVPTTTFDADGKLWAVWVFGKHLYVNHSSDLGETFSTPVKVNAAAKKISTNGESRPHIKVAKNGNIYVSYAIKLKKRFSGHVMFSRSTDDGKSFSTPIIVNDNQDMIGHSFPYLEINADDQPFIAWLDSRDRVAAKKTGDDYNGSALYYAVSNDDGVSFEANQKIADTTCQCCRLGVAMDNNDLPVVSWRHIFGDNIRDQAIVRFTDNGSFTDARRISEDQWKVEACPHHGSTLAVDNNGDYHTAWFTNGSVRQGLFYAHSNSQGEQFSTPLPFGDLDAQPKHPSLVAVANKLYLAWREFDGSQSHIRLKQSDDGGTEWTATQTIASTADQADYPMLISDGETPYLSWHTKAEGFQLIPLAAPKATATAPLDFVSGSMAQITAQQEGPYIVNFWSIDCPSCFKEMKMWRELEKEYPSMKVVLISTDASEFRDEVMQTTIDLGVNHFESWQFADSADRLRFEIDRRWFGELPRTYFRDRNGNTEAISGLVKRELVEQWLQQNTTATSVASTGH